MFQKEKIAKLKKGTEVKYWYKLQKMILIIKIHNTTEGNIFYYGIIFFFLSKHTKCQEGILVEDYDLNHNMGESF